MPLRGEGLSQMISGSAIPASHEVGTRETCMKGSPLGVGETFL
jgi:hypothetical protein